FLRAQQLLKISSVKLTRAQYYLADANDRLNGIIEGSDDLIAAIDLQLNFIAFNSKYKSEILRVFKIHLKLGMNFNILLKQMELENQQKTLSLWTKAFEGQSFTVIESFHDKHFPDLYYEIHYNPIRNYKNELIGASHTAINVNQRIINEKKIAHAKQQLEHLVTNLENQNKELILLKEMMSLLQSSLSFETIAKPISTYAKKILKSTSGIIFLIDKYNIDTFKEITFWGHPLIHQHIILKTECWALLRGQSHQVSQEDDSVWCQHVGSHRKKPQAYVCRPMYAQGEILGLLYMEMHQEDAENKRLIYLAQILSEQIALSFYNIKLKDELTLESTHDSLTGLYNRRFFEGFLDQEIFKGKDNSFALLLIDIDHFKKINDLHGHLFGDKVLQYVAEQLSNNCQKNDILCRWGGEEFFLFLHEETANTIAQRAELIRHSIETLVINHNPPIAPITISIGVAFYPDNGKDLDTLTEKADKALYQAKKDGRNKVIISGN
ncbi:MAG: sensor domain-containing diguanylate cyclase, partial [bacterium]|nr:sensor domain-containing diguanylate cyclase [bacterium]